MAGCVYVDVDRRWWVGCCSGSRVGNGQWVTSIEGWIGSCFGGCRRRDECSLDVPSTIIGRVLPLGLHPFILGTCQVENSQSEATPLPSWVTCNFCRLRDDMPTFV